MIMSNSLNFTRSNLTKIEVPKNGTVIYKDTLELGLILIVSNGSKIFYLNKLVNGIATKIRIAAFPDFTVAQARKKVVELKKHMGKAIEEVREQLEWSNQCI